MLRPISFLKPCFRISVPFFTFHLSHLLNKSVSPGLGDEKWALESSTAKSVF